MSRMSWLEKTYTYAPNQVYEQGWILTEVDGLLHIEKNDEEGSFESDDEACYHVMICAAIDAGPEGDNCRMALRQLIAQGYDAAYLAKFGAKVEMRDELQS